jgi:NADH:ubiquinone oxidoreductase subunit H
MTLLDFVLMVVKIVAIFAAVMTMVPVMIYAERKVVAGFQVRVGPNRWGRGASFSRSPMPSS